MFIFKYTNSYSNLYITDIFHTDYVCCLCYSGNHHRILLWYISVHNCQQKLSIVVYNETETRT
jgi:hypothetical protein